jgi:hypothetical protein
MTLTRAGCSRLFKSTIEKPPAAWEGRASCQNCAIGALYSGLKVAPTALAVKAMSLICPRCDKYAARLINERVCVSCYNRELEFRSGKNAKGTRPRLTLRPGQIVVRDGAIQRTVGFEFLKNHAEAIVILSKRAAGPLSFGLVPVPFVRDDRVRPWPDGSMSMGRVPPVLPGSPQIEICLPTRFGVVALPRRKVWFRPRLIAAAAARAAIAQTSLGL